MRLLDDSPARGAWNMARDEALLDGLAAGIAPPTLRFYGWEPACLSLGYAQDAADVDAGACAEAGVDVVRRPTGGRAVLHAAELTYAITQPVGTETVRESYRRIAQAIARAISRLGVAAAVLPGDRPSRDRPAAVLPGDRPSRDRPADCFALSTAADLVVAGRKVSGAAQVRRHGFLLQHGSIKLGPAPVRIARLLRKAGPPPLTLAELLDQPVDVALLKRLIAEELGVAWRPADATEEEEALARAIAARTSFSRRPPDRLPAHHREAD